MFLKTSLFLTTHSSAHCSLTSLMPLQTSHKISATINPSQQTISSIYLSLLSLKHLWLLSTILTLEFSPPLASSKNYYLLVLTLKQPVSISWFISSSQLGMTESLRIPASVFSFLQMVPIPSSENSQLCLPFLFYAEEFNQKSSS